LAISENAPNLFDTQMLHNKVADFLHVANYSRNPRKDQLINLLDWLEFCLVGWKMFYSHPYVMFEKGILWLNVPYVEKKSALLRRLGRWPANQIRVARKQNLQSGSLSTVENLSDLLWARGKSNLIENATFPSFFSFSFRRYSENLKSKT